MVRVGLTEKAKLNESLEGGEGRTMEISHRALLWKCPWWIQGRLRGTMCLDWRGMRESRGEEIREVMRCEKWGAEPPRIQLIMKDMGRCLRNIPHEHESDQF